MNARSPHRSFVLFTAGTVVVTAVLSVAVTALRRGPAPDTTAPLEGRADDAALDHLRRLLAQRHGLKVLVEGGRAAIAWNDGFRLQEHGLLDYLRTHRFTFAATLGATGAPDVYRARARVNAEGVPIELTDLVNLTRTAHGHEEGLAVRGPFVAFLNRIDGRLRQVVLLDYRGADRDASGQGLLDRLMDGVANWQQVGDWRGVGRRTLEFAKSPARASLRFDGPELVVDFGAPEAARVDPETGRVRGAPGLHAMAPTPRARRMLLDWVANTVRRFIGERRFEWLKVYALALKDKWKRFVGALFGPGAPETDEVEQNRVVAAHAPVKRLQQRFGQDPNWPPPPVEPILKHPPLRGEGQWVDIYDFDLRNPGAPPALLKTVIRPDPRRPHAAVRIVLMDPRQVDLHIVAGTRHPESTTGQQGDGLIPRDRETLSRLLAAFNGGFKTMHGAYGMMVKDKVIVPAQPGAATVARLRDGRIALGTWTLPARTNRRLLSFRQNLPPLIEDGVVNPTGLRKWGNTVSDMDGTHTYRSALGVTRHGHLMYVWGDDLSAITMARAMVQAGCQYAIHLDMNHGHSRFEFYRVYWDDEAFERRHPTRRVYVEGGIRYQAKKLSQAQISWLFPRYIKRDIRDFFYVTLRRVFPYDDPTAPPWSTDGLPPQFAEFPPLLVRATVRSRDQDVRVFKLDGSRLRLHLRLGGAEAKGAPAAAREIAPEDIPRLAGAIAAGEAEGSPPGTRIAGRDLVPPRPSAMTLLLDARGRARIERWSGATSGAAALRQGLALVEGGQVCPEARAARADFRLRGALGVDRRGDLLYAVARTASPALLAEALVAAGARRALALGPGRSDAFFHLYTDGESPGSIVATDLTTDARAEMPSLPLSHPQSFLYLLPEAPPPRVIALSEVEKDERRASPSAPATQPP